MFRGLFIAVLAASAFQCATAQYRVVDLTPSVTDSQMLLGQDGWAEGNGNAGGVQVGAGVSAGDSTSVFRQAAMWQSSSSSLILLMPLVYSEAYGTDGLQEVGFVENATAHAALWSGSAASYVDLHPLGYSASVAYAVSSGIQSGWGLTPPTIQGFPAVSDDDNRFTVVPGGSHALKWSGTAASVVDLNPANFDASISWGTENGVQIGSGVGSDDGVTHALRWTGTPDSFVDISPVTDWSGGASVAMGIHNGQTAGYSTVLGSRHATIWNGTDRSTSVDIHPSAFYQSVARATNGVTQVGYGVTGVGLSFGLTFEHALAWTGTADSVVDLHQFLPQGWQNSVATAVADDGTIVVTAFYYQPGNQVSTGAFSFSGGTLITHNYLLIPSDPPACAVASVTVDQTSIQVDSQRHPETPVNGTVTLTSPAPPGGAVIRLLNTIFQGRETSVTVPEGQTSATFLATDPLLFYPDDLNREQPITASYGGVTKGTHYVSLGPDQQFIFSGPIRPGLIGEIQFATPLDADEVVSLGSSDPTLVQVPPHILLKRGMAYAEYPYNITPSLVTTNVTIGGTCSRGFFGGTITVHAYSRPVATISGISPSTVISGQPFTMSLTGNFAPGAQVFVSGAPVPTHQQSSTDLTADIPSDATPTSAQYAVTVQNPKAYPSAAVNLTAVGPTLGGLSPGSAIAGVPFTLTLSGTNFVPGASVLVGGGNTDPIVLPATYVSSTRLSTIVPASAIPVAGSVQIWVRNPNSFADTNAMALGLNNPKPVITSLSPSVIPSGSPTTTVTVSGSGFVSSSQGRLAGTNVATTYISPSLIQITIPASMLARRNNLSVTVQNPSPGGGGSNGFTLTIS